MLDQGVLVGDHKHRGAPAVDLAEQVHNLEGQGRVDIAGGLVGHDHAGVVHQGPGQADPLLLAAGEFGGVVLGLVLQSHQAEDVGHPFFDGPGRSPHHPHGKGHVVIHGHVVDQAEILEHDAHLPADIGDFPLADVGHVHPVYDHLAGVGPLLAHDELEEGALSRAGRAHDKHKLAFFHVQVDVVQGLGAVVIYFRYIAKFNQMYPSSPYGGSQAGRGRSYTQQHPSA